MPVSKYSPVILQSADASPDLNLIKQCYDAEQNGVYDSQSLMHLLIFQADFSY